MADDDFDLDEKCSASETVCVVSSGVVCLGGTAGIGYGIYAVIESGLPTVAKLAIFGSPLLLCALCAGAFQLKQNLEERYSYDPPVDLQSDEKPLVNDTEEQPNYQATAFNV